MAKYHVNPRTGNPNVCRAAISCPYGGEENHYASKEAARSAYEEKMKAVAAGDTSVELAIHGYEKILKKQRSECQKAVKNLEVADRSVKHYEAQMELDARPINSPDELLNERMAQYREELEKISFFNKVYEESKAIEEEEALSQVPEDKRYPMHTPKYTTTDKLLNKALRVADFGLFAGSGVATATTVIAANSGRPGTAILMGAVAAATSAPHWLNAVKEAYHRRQEKERIEKEAVVAQDGLTRLNPSYDRAQKLLSQRKLELQEIEKKLKKTEKAKAAAEARSASA